MTLYRTIFLSLPLVLAVGCGGDKDDDTGMNAEVDADGSADDDGSADADGSADGSADADADGGAADGTGEVRLAHFGVFPDDTGTEVDVFVNGEASGISFAFKETTDFVELPVGSYDFDIVPAGGTIEQSVFTVEGFDLAADTQWSVYAAGYVADPDSGNGFTVGAIQEDRAAVPAGKVRVQVVHAAALGALDPVDVWVVDGDCAPVDPLATDFAFNTNGIFDLDSTGINVGFDVSQDGTVDACFMIPDVGITDEIVTVYAVNTDGGDVSLVAHLPDGSPVELAPAAM